MEIINNLWTNTEWTNGAAMFYGGIFAMLFFTTVSIITVIVMSRGKAKLYEKLIKEMETNNEI